MIHKLHSLIKSLLQHIQYDFIKIAVGRKLDIEVILTLKGTYTFQRFYRGP